MSLLVVDCSVTMAWCFEDECDSYADGVLAALGQMDALVPPIWRLEVANVLLVAERQGRLSKAATTRFVELVQNLPIVVEEPAPQSGFASLLGCGRDYGLTAYDAAYLELAMRLGVPLATNDKQLREACDRSGTELFAS